jgi:pimeloyl-ACP methyl ester carboxylesterase
MGRRHHKQYFLTFAALVGVSTPGFGARYFVSIPPSDGAKYKEANYAIWLPHDVGRLRAIIVHQHGCGLPAERAGETATYDLQWQALATKWDCALMGSSYRADTACSDWCHPANGSGEAFLRAIAESAQASGHAELADVPWVLWGHSGGAEWVYRMFMQHPKRVLVLVLRSGPPFLETTYTGSLETPVLHNLGVKERDHERFGKIWRKAGTLFQARRARGSFDTWAPDPESSHDCRYGRLLVIPYVDACLARHWGNQPRGQLDPSAGWLPNGTMMAKWEEFTKTGWVTDTTPPPAPHHLTVRRRAGEQIVLTWEARADLESGIRSFRIYRDGVRIADWPRDDKPFQKPNYHDTLERPLAEMRYVDTAAGATHEYEVTAVNFCDLESPKSDPATIAQR